ncbi:MAG: crossover junction endodeoxyribonuclease RuvC [Sphaerochaetaceae bacterium]|nr:crossover junction endodeoxyribonuclease RuvC [Sphaerochaetaceae bacterium]
MSIVLGIDPGLANTGWGVLESSSGRLKPIFYGCVITEAHEPMQQRIGCIASTLEQVIKRYDVTEASMEDIFFAKNASSAISVAKVIGAISYMLFINGIKLSLYTPLQIKSAIVGYGNADKRQVQEMARILLGMDKVPSPNHAADALSAAVTHTFFESTQSRLSLGM